MVELTPEENLLEIINKYNPDFDKAFVVKAIDFAREYHGVQKRASGDPYYYHPISVATIIAELKLDTASVITALLHDTVEDTEATIEQIEEEFGADIAHIVNGVTKLDKINFRTESEKQAENFRKFLMAISEDIRVLLIKLADRLHNMRTLQYIRKPEKRRRIAKETMDIYAPLAERIGIHKIKSELQDIAFRELNPDAYDSVLKRLEYLRGIDQDLVQRTTEQIQKLMEDAGIKVRVSGREKMPFSVWLKMQRKNIGFESVTDINAFRIVTENTDDAYRALGVIHTKYRMVPGYFDDYISVPKANGYQSVHTIIIGEEKQRIEVQIRTERMHSIAEYGVAAHWSYKQGQSYGIEGSKYKWVRQLLDILENASDPEEIIENTKLEMYHDHVFCFTPNGDLIVLPRDGTPVDFAFAVHTNLGIKCAGAKVNNRVVPLRTKLRNGDQVEIIKAKAETIIPSWESFVKTGKARSEIRKFLRGKKEEEYIELGKSMLKQIYLQNAKEFEEKDIIELLEDFNRMDLPDFYCSVGEGSIKRSEVVKRLFPDSESTKERTSESEINKNSEIAQIPLKGLTDGVSVSFGSCCHPLPGERIVGIQSATGVVVHTTDCIELENYQDNPDKWIDLRWDDKDEESSYLSRLELIVVNKKGALAELAGLCAEADSNINNVRIGGKGQDFCNVIIDLEVKNIQHLARVETKLKTSSLTNSVERFKPKVSLNS